MPILNRRTLSLARVPETPAPERWTDATPTPVVPRPSGSRLRLLETCANPACSSGWLQIWRSRSAPIFESGWNCSSQCTEQRLAAAVRRELDGRGSSAEVHRHRIPLGLLMLEQGWITAPQLRGALEAQRTNRAGRLGHWLMVREGISEQLVTRALGLQWSCPVLPFDYHDAEGMAALVPRLFVDAFATLPLRVAAGKVLYLGFADRLDASLALAVERISGLRVESGLVPDSRFRPAHRRMLEARFPSVELLEAASEPALVRALTRAIERTRPIESRLVRVHDCLWLRLWRKPQDGPVADPSAVNDMICTLAG